MKTNAAEAEHIEDEAPPVDQDVVQVPIADDDDDDVQQAQDPQSRQDRRSSYKKLKEAHESEKAERAREREEANRRFQEYDRQLAELRGSVSARPAQQQQAQQPDPATQAEQEIAYWEGQMDQAIAAVQHAAPGTPANILEQHRTTYKQAQRQMYAAIARAQQAPQSQQPQQPPNVQGEMLRMQHPKIFADDALRLEAQAEAIRLMRTKGERTLSYETALEANERVYARHGLGGKKQAPPNESDRQKLVGTSARAGSSGGQGSTVPMSKADRRTAIAYYSGDHPLNHLSDEEKIARYAKRIKSKPDQA